MGARRCPPRRRPAEGVVKAVHVHHTVSLNDYTPAEAPAIVLAICRYHRYSNGWDDIGYHALVDRFGVLYEGRAGGLDRPVVGAQAQGYNAQTASIASIGDHRVVEQPAIALEAMARYPLEAPGPRPADLRPGDARQHGRLAQPLSRRAARAGRPRARPPRHRPDRVPRRRFYAQLAELRALVAAGLPPSGPGLPATGPPTLLSAALGVARTFYGRPVGVSGTLLTDAGAPAAGQPCRWRPRPVGAGYPRRADDRRRRRLDDRGDPPPPRCCARALTVPMGWGPARARGCCFACVPSCGSADYSPRSARPPRGRARRVSPAKAVVYQVLQQRIAGRYRRVGVRVVAVRKGRFRGSFTPSFTGRYRVYVAAKADSVTDRGRSGLRVIRVSPRH